MFQKEYFVVMTSKGEGGIMRHWRCRRVWFWQSAGMVAMDLMEELALIDRKGFDLIDIRRL